MLMLTIQAAAEADTRLGFNIYPAMTEICNFFQKLATNTEKQEAKKKNRSESKQEESWKEKEKENTLALHNKK